MSHPSAELLEASAFGWLPEAEAERIHVHGASCLVCGQALRNDEFVQRRLAFLWTAEPRTDVSARLRDRLEQAAQAERRRPIVRAVRLALLAVALATAAGLLVASQPAARRKLRRGSRRSSALFWLARAPGPGRRTPPPGALGLAIRNAGSSAQRLKTRWA
jgi:hypothetical protein